MKPDTLKAMQTVLAIMLISLSACAGNEDDIQISLNEEGKYGTPEHLLQTEVYQRHAGSAVKILAIGNSFTHNAATYMPFLIENLNADSICIAKLTRSSCSLKMHWDNHLSNNPDYEFYYSDAGKWIESEINTIDEALLLFDWDIIVLQQASVYSGYYSTYEPYLSNLLDLIKTYHPEARTAWHCTWAYREGTDHPNFDEYDRSPQKMYDAIMETSGKVSEKFDITIPAATLIWEMRKAFPDAEDGFSADGYHISSPVALYALSTLWYEYLLSARCGTSSRSITDLPSSIDRAMMNLIFEIPLKSLN